MAVSVSATLSAMMTATRTATTAGGISSTIRVSPTNAAGTSFGASTTPAATKLWTGTVSLTAAPATLDLTALTGGEGDTSFAKVFAFSIQNNATTAGSDVTFGGAAADEFVFGQSAAATLDVAPGQTFALATTAAAGWTTTGATDLKLDPGAATLTATVTIIGA